MKRRVAVVTGAGQGIGRDYAWALAEDGHMVIAADLNEQAVRTLAEEAAGKHLRVLGMRVDVSDKQSVDELAAAVRADVGPVGILVNNAAIYHSMRNDKQLTVDIEYWRKVFSVNVDGALLCTQAFAPDMQAEGWGRVVVQTSTAAYLGGGGHYGVTKTALIALTQGFARELGGSGVTVNAIAPGPIDTEATRTTVPDGTLERLAAQIPMGRVGTTADLLAPLRFLVSEGAGWTTGQVLVVDGGLVKRL
jgi:3-oxoacyl-[acyl-carrier protein] reductase